MNVLDLFSGIGGFSLGLERAGFTTVAFCEVEAFCQRVLRKHWPDVPIHSDIRELDGAQYRGTVDVVCGGFPCQPFSQAGQRKGADDDRHLWPEMLRVIREAQPAWVIGENVVGLETLGLEQCVSDLEGDGFAVQVFDIPACGVGAHHRRHRLWIVAHASGNGIRNESGRGNGQGWSGPSELGDNGKAGAAADSPGSGFQGWPKPNGLSSKASGGGPGDTGGTHGCGEFGWPTEPPVCGADDGIPNRVDRLRALGNAVVPQIPEIIGRAIMETSK